MTDRFEPSPRAAWRWDEARRGAARQWTSAGVRIRTARNSAGFLVFRVVFPNGRLFNAPSLADAQEYAEQYGKDHGAAK